MRGFGYGFKARISIYIEVCCVVCYILTCVDNGEVEDICTRLQRLQDTEIVHCAVDEHHRWYSITGLFDHGQVIRDVQSLLVIYY